MERRLQLLLDQDRYDRVSQAATSSGRSVSAVIRDAIDVAYPSGDEARQRALARFLALTEEPADGPSESWPEIKRQLEDDVAADLTRFSR